MTRRHTSKNRGRFDSSEYVINAKQIQAPQLCKALRRGKEKPRQSRGMTAAPAPAAGLPLHFPLFRADGTG